jgi:hypothetical protein
VVAETSAEKSWKQRWSDCADFLFEASVLSAPEELERMLLSISLNWKIDALLVAEARAAYRVLPAIKQRMPGLRTADVVADLDAIALTDNTIDSLDYRLARSKTAARGLEGMSMGHQQVGWLPYGVALAEGKRFGTEVAVGFRGRLDAAGGANLLPALAGELERLMPGAQISWVIAGYGPLESRLRQAFSHRDATFIGEREPAADLLIVLSEGSRGDWISLEALRRGTPVVAFHTDSREEMVAEGCGILVTGGRDGEFRVAAAVAGLLNDRAAMEAMSEAARLHVAQFYSIGGEVAQGRAFLEQLLGDAKGKIQL